jgi:hypothetical protein
MFEHLKAYDKILVTGPQRSGTRIAAKMIAYDTGYEFVDEEHFGVHSETLFRGMVAGRSEVIIQCPGLSHAIHRYSYDDTLIIMMIRDVEDIVKSEKRIKWARGYWDELLKLGIDYNDLRRARREGVRPSELKYELWETKQRDMVENYLELEYESLKDHPLWIPKEKRQGFKETQTE